jgi:PqqD family protein of HPr-rel-A system
MNMGWRTVKLLWREWDGETVVYNVNSGNTHLLNPTAVEVLRMIERDVLTAGELSDRLMNRLGGSSNEEIMDGVKSLLVNLDHLGLVETLSQ